MNGKGIMTYPDGKRYEGDFQDDERNGKGKFIWNKKKWYEGEWKNSKQNGEGILYFDGRKVKGTWKNGQVGKIIHPKNLDLR
jgi:hypothetical protein